MNKASKQGFTLLEVVAAVALFAFAVLALTRSGTSSLRNSMNSENITQAAQLLQLKMAELETEIQIKLDKEGVSAVLGESEGVFEKPFENYSWRSEVAENPFQLENENLLGVLTSFGVDESLAEVQLEESAIVMNNLRKTLNENLVELYLEVLWDEFGFEKSMPVVTHLIPRQPKIRLTLDRGSS